MSYLTALYNSYCRCEKEGLVDNPSSPIDILPIYHSNLNSNGFNIIELSIDQEGNIKNARWILEDEKIVFPVTEDSVSRSGRFPAPHPLVDKFQYMDLEKESRLNEMYLEGLNSWREFSRNHGGIPIIESVYKLIHTADLFEKILAQLYAKDKIISINDREVEVLLENNRTKKIDFKDVFITFNLIDKDILSVSKSKELHQQYIQYTEHLNKQKEQNRCNITGQIMYCSNKHRGMMGNAKIMSVSNNRETYIGRFQKGEDVFNIGYQTSQKIHLMLKALLENESSNTYMGDNQTMIVWFSDDISNERKVKMEHPFFTLENASKSEEEEEETYTPNKDFGRIVLNAFRTGKAEIEGGESFYILFIDKLNNGRIAIKYFRELPQAELINRLNKWVKNNSWYSFDPEKNEEKITSPSIYSITNVAFGVERNKKLVPQKDSFRKKVNQDLIQAIVDGKMLPIGVKSAIEQNIKSRQKYDDTWNLVYYIALACLRSDYVGGDSEMPEDLRNSRSFLFGRLLAVFDIAEEATYDMDSSRTTNAQRYWNVYTAKPEQTMHMLLNKVKPYMQKLQNNPAKVGLAVKYEKAMTAIINELEDKNYYSGEANKPLDYNFIYGYYSERRNIFKKSDKQEEKND